MVALDRFEQMHAEPFDLIGADARQDAGPGACEIAGDLRRVERAHRQIGAVAVLRPGFARRARARKPRSADGVRPLSAASVARPLPSVADLCSSRPSRVSVWSAPRHSAPGRRALTSSALARASASASASPPRRAARSALSSARSSISAALDLERQAGARRAARGGWRSSRRGPAVRGRSKGREGRHDGRRLQA